MNYLDKIKELSNYLINNDSHLAKNEKLYDLLKNNKYGLELCNWLKSESNNSNFIAQII